MKYKLINIATQEETICDKLVIDNFDYYVSDNCSKHNDYCYYNKDTKNPIKYQRGEYLVDGNFAPKVIATNNPNIDLPKVVDEASLLADLAMANWGNIHRTGVLGYIDGYNKAKETYQFTEQDMIDFTNYAKSYKSSSIVKKAFEIWKAQKTTTIYYQATP